MKLRVVLAAALLALGSAAVSPVAQATTYDLTQNYSSSANPNPSGWVYTFAGTPLTHYDHPNTVGSNHLSPAIPGDYFSANGSDLNSSNPFVFKAAVDGSDANGNPGTTLQDTDFHAGDIVVHSPNDGANALLISWVAPTAGTISDVLTSVWYAHSTVERTNHVVLSIAGAVIASFDVTKADDRDHPLDYDSLAQSFAVAAGDLLTLSFARTSPSFGSLNGVSAAFTFTAATPIPAALPLFMSALAGLGWVARRRRNAAA
jgi:hypothetical protein